jgi:periplasmic divalent cation tolerance protein
MEFAIVLTTFPADGDPAPLARTLVEERLAACVNVLPPMSSTYRWQGAVEIAEERQLVIKTTAGRIEALERRIAELHPYDVPEILTIPVGGASAAYGAWLGDSTVGSG